MNLNSLVTEVLDQYLLYKSKGKSINKDYTVYNTLNRELPRFISNLKIINQNGYLVEGSAGQGLWAEVPWVAIFDPDITSSAQEGYYICYLFNKEMDAVYLTLIQSITKEKNAANLGSHLIRNVVGEKREGLVAYIHSLNLEIPIKVNFAEPPSLGTTERAKKYSHSTIAYIKYDKGNIPSGKELIKDLEGFISIYKLYKTFDKSLENSDMNEENLITVNIVDKKPQFEQIISRTLITHIHNYITSKGFNYTEANIKNLYLSLRSKPFVIISGISGTGKTKIVQLLAESIGATEDNGQFALIPVRPDWSDSSDLLGYKDIKEEFQKGPLTKVIERAHQNPELPYFVLLDEMNLARVEYYFSDVLSVMETRREEDGKIVSSQLISYKNQQKETVSVTLPNNLYVIGTVNMDETTHPFSKKVLDRANTIEFNEINFETNDFVEGEVNPIKIGNEQFEATYLFLKQAYPGNEDLVKQVSAELTEINEILQTIHAQVGYRVRDEICYYMIHNKNWDLMDYKVALDTCIMQKILPRISGSSDHVEKMLKSLYLRYAGKEYVKDAVVDKTASLTERKLVEMIRRLVRDGFTSFWGA